VRTWACFLVLQRARSLRDRVELELARTLRPGGDYGWIPLLPPAERAAFSDEVALAGTAFALGEATEGTLLGISGGDRLVVDWIRLSWEPVRARFWPWAAPKVARPLAPVTSPSRSLSSGGTGKFAAEGPPPPRAELTPRTQPVHQPLQGATVPSAARRWRESVADYADNLERRRITLRHRQERARVARNVGGLLEGAGLGCRPEDFGPDHLDHLLRGPWSRLEGNSKAYNACLLNLFLKSRGNLTVERAQLRFDRTPVRPKEALTRSERVRLLDAARQLGIVPYSIVVLELTMNLRRSEVLRLTVDQVESDPIVFRGKGREIEQGGGKVRRVPKHPLFRELLPELLAHRREIVRGREAEDPGFLLVHAWGGRLGPWHKAWVDRQFVGPAFDRAGIRKRWNLNHALRRTWIRAALIEQRQKLAVVSELAGHSDTRTTLGYAALNDDDRREVMDSLSDAFGAPLAPRSQPKGGEIGHAD